MIEISGYLKTKEIQEAQEYKIFETDHKILRVSNPKTKEWYDLRPLAQGTETFASIINALESKPVLSNQHGYGLVVCHGVFHYENCDFLVTDPFGGYIFSDYLKGISIEDTPKFKSKDINLFILDLTSTLLRWKNFHGYISSQTMMIDKSSGSVRGGLICFPEESLLESHQEFLRPQIYLKKLANNQLIPDDQYALALLILQVMSLNQGIYEPLSTTEVLQKFVLFLKEKEIYRYFSFKLAPYIQKLLNGSVTIDEVHVCCQEMAKEIESGIKREEILTRALQVTDGFSIKLSRNSLYHGFSCPYCGVIAPRFPNSQGTEPCPVCKRCTVYARVLDRKICQSCKSDFDSSKEFCSNCSSGEISSISSSSLEVIEPLLPVLEGTGEAINPLTILPGFEEIELPSEKQNFVAKEETRSVGKTRAFARQEPDKREMTKAIPVMEKDFTSMQCLCQGNNLMIEVKDANPGKWKLQIAMDEKGEKALEERDYISVEKKDLRCGIALDQKELSEQPFVFVLLYKEGEYVCNQKVLLDSKNKSILGKIWK
ncbi:MAG: hypothetical protein HUU50_11435 [Candidatus Brocadiae bacterium]|nr:hypothetical protein [Candidatus Brocadiia bacterium]